jgi:hypothetical protein
MGKKLEGEQQKDESTEPTPKKEAKEDIQLSGFNLDEFKAKPLDPRAQRKKTILTMPVGKPSKQHFFRVHKKLEYPAYVLDWEDERISYLITPQIAELIPNQVKYKILYVAIYETGSPFLLSVIQPDSEGRWNNWHQSLSEAVTLAKKQWIRLEADLTTQGYNIIHAIGDYGAPEWPNMTIEQYLAIAFKNTQIKDENHPRIKELFGQQ